MISPSDAIQIAAELRRKLRFCPCCGHSPVLIAPSSIRRDWDPFSTPGIRVTCPRCRRLVEGAFTDYLNADICAEEIAHTWLAESDPESERLMRQKLGIYPSDRRPTPSSPESAAPP